MALEDTCVHVLVLTIICTYMYHKYIPTNLCLNVNYSSKILHYLLAVNHNILTSRGGVEGDLWSQISVTLSLPSYRHHVACVVAVGQKSSGSVALSTT